MHHLQFYCILLKCYVIATLPFSLGVGGGGGGQRKQALLVKKHFLKSSKKWKHLHKCCFHGHLSCFCLALNEKTMSGFWPEPKTKKVSKLSWLTRKQPGGVGWAEQGCWGLGVEDLDSCTRGVMEKLGLAAKKKKKRDGGFCSKPRYLRETFWCMMGGIK